MDSIGENVLPLAKTFLEELGQLRECMWLASVIDNGGSVEYKIVGRDRTWSFIIGIALPPGYPQTADGRKKISVDAARGAAEWARDAMANTNVVPRSANAAKRVVIDERLRAMQGYDEATDVAFVKPDADNSSNHP